MNKSWKIVHEEGIRRRNDDCTMEIELEYDHEVDLFTLKIRSWDYDPKDKTTYDEIILYPKDLSEISKLFSKAMKECKNAGWMENKEK